MFNRIVMSLLALFALFSTLACEERPAAAPASSATDALPANLILTTAPEGAKGVAEVRASAKDGDNIVIRGVVAGRADPIAENRAVFTLLDPSIKTCDKTEGDSCETPWDACCEPVDILAANSATVQVVDEDGKPLKIGLKAVDGLAPLKHVVVVGKYKPSSDGKAVIVNVQSLYVEK